MLNYQRVYGRLEVILYVAVGSSWKHCSNRLAAELIEGLGIFHSHVFRWGIH